MGTQNMIDVCERIADALGEIADTLGEISEQINYLINVEEVE